MTPQEIADGVNSVLEDFSKDVDRFEGEAVNWADLRVVEIYCKQYLYPLEEEEEVPTVVIEEVSPDSWGFGQAVAEEFENRHGKKINVVVEW